MDTNFECSYSTRLSNVNIIGTIAKLEAQIAIELGEPWASVPIKSIHFPQDLNHLAPQLAKLKIEFGINYFAKNEHSIANHTRAFIFKRKESEFEPFQKLEILVPNERLHELTFFALEFLTSGKILFQDWEISTHKAINELFVCIHNERDHCCGKYGLQLYNLFQEMITQKYKSQFRVWKSSHLGGHRYAPTFYEAPAMRWFGLFNLNDVSNFLNREEGQFKVKNNYRGMSGIAEKYALLAENELFKMYSWKWLEVTEKKYELLNLKENGSAKVKFFYKLPGSIDFASNSFQIHFDKMVEGKSSCSGHETTSIKQYLVQEI